MWAAVLKRSPGKGFSLLLLLNFFLSGLQLSAQLPSIRQINIRQGLPQSEVMCMFEDSRGYLWAGTRGGGLVRVNGNELTVFNSSSGLASNFISDLSECKNGKLLITTSYGGLHFLHGKKIRQIPAEKSIREYLKTIPLNDSLFYVLHPDGIALFNHTSGFKNNIFTFPSAINRIHQREIVGNRWLLISSDSGLYSIDTKSPARSVFLKNATNLSGHRIAAIRVLNRQSAVLISSDGMAASLDFSDQWPLLEPWVKLPQFRLQTGEEIRHVVFERDHSIKNASSSKNRILYAGLKETDLSRLNGMKIPLFSGILKDRNDRLIIGTLGSGILMVPEQSALSYSEYPQLANSRFSAVLRTANGQILCGGAGTGVLVFHPEKKEISCIFPETDVLAISETPDHYLIGTSTGFRRLRKTDFSEADFFTGIGKVVSFRYLPDRRLLIGSSGKGLWMLEPGKKPIACTASGSDPAFAYGILPFSGESNLIISNTGLWKFRPGSAMLEKLNVPDSVAGSFFLGTRDIYGNYWFSSTDGLVCLRGKSWSKIGIRDGLSSTLIYTLNADFAGNLWVGSSKGLDKITVDKSGRALKIINYGPEEGFDGYEANMRGSYMGRDALYLCTIQGLFSVSISENRPDPEPPVPQISSILSSRNNRFDTLFSNGLFPGISLPAQFDITRSSDLLMVDFTAINPVYPSRIKYSFRLIGSDTTWSEPASETRAGFALPSSGIYRFEVRSTYNGVDFSRPAVVEFRIASPWYFSWLILVPGVFILLILYLAYYLFYRKKHGSGNVFFQRDARWTESTGHQVILFLATFYPLLPFLAARFDASVCIHPAQQLAVACLFAGVFLLTIFSVSARSRMDSMLKGLFFLMVADSSFGLLHNHLSPFYAGLLLSVSALSLIVFAEQISVMLYGLFLNVFAYFCSEYLNSPLFPPASYQLVCAGLSIVLVLVALVRQSSEDKWLFASRVVNDGPVLVLAFSENEHLVFASSNVSKLTGFHFDALKDIRWKTCLPAEGSDLKQVEEILRNRENMDFRIRIRRADSGFRTFRFTCTAINPRITTLLGEDISEKEMLESRFENLVVNAGDSIFQTDLGGKILYSNPQCSLLLGIGPEEIQGKYFTKFVPEEYRARVIAFFNDQLEQENSGASIEFPVITRNGFHRWMAFQTSMLKTSGANQTEGVLAIGRDITERMEAEQLIRIQHKNISDSLTYASRIRQALQPGKASLSSMFSEFALLDQPKDIIGGDFIWLGQNGIAPLLVLGDCTGHGVPGAFMTTISMGLFRERVENDEVQKLETLLGNFNRALNASFGRAARSSDETFDFAELALVSLDKTKAELLYISSGIGLHRVRNGEFMSFPEASKGLNYRLDYSGLEQRIPLEPEDVFYLFSDGLFDQIGGPAQKRFSKMRLKEAILASDQKNLAKGMQEIQAALAAWQGNCPQTDDRIMISFRV